MKRQYLRKADRAKGCDWCGGVKNEPVRGFSGHKAGHFAKVSFHTSCAKQYLESKE